MAHVADLRVTFTETNFMIANLSCNSLEERGDSRHFDIIITFVSLAHDLSICARTCHDEDVESA